MLRALRWILVTTCLGLLTSGTAIAEPVKSDTEVVRQAMWLKSKGKLEEAKEYLSRWSELRPSSEPVAIARAELYLAEDNPFWALKVLSEFALSYPKACDAKTFIARVQLQQANLDEAEEALSDVTCDEPEALKVRRLLLRAELAELRNDGKTARRLVTLAEGYSARYEEDDVRLAQLERAYEPFRLPLWDFELDAAAGYVSTGYGQVPLEVTATQKNQGSAIANLHLRGRVVLPFRPSFRPLAEIEFSGTEQLNSRANAFSVRQPAFRVGALIGRGLPRLQLNYAFDFVDFDGKFTGDASGKWFSSAHRGEYRLDWGQGFVSFGGVGYRAFANRQLSRVESEHGILKAWGLEESLAVSTGATLRTYAAERRAFDQVGGSGFLGLTVQAPKGFTLLETLTLSRDHFPASEHYFVPNLADRVDVSLRANATVMAPEMAGMRFAVSYGYVSRDSNVALYDVTDHRALLEVHVRMNHDEWRAQRISQDGRVPMHHEKELPKNVEPLSRSVRDAIKQDEELRRGSSCLK